MLTPTPIFKLQSEESPVSNKNWLMFLSNDLSLKTLYLPIFRGRKIHDLDDNRDEKNQSAMMAAEATK